MAPDIRNSPGSCNHPRAYIKKTKAGEKGILSKSSSKSGEDDPDMCLVLWTRNWDVDFRPWSVEIHLFHGLDGLGAISIVVRVITIAAITEYWIPI